MFDAIVLFFLGAVAGCGVGLFFSGELVARLRAQVEEQEELIAEYELELSAKENGIGYKSVDR